MKKYFAIGFLMIALMLVLPTFAKAENVNVSTTAINVNTNTGVENLMISSQQQLSRLLEQINKLQAELSRLQGEVKKVGEQIEKLTKSLKLGTEGKEVETLQKFLKQDPEIYPEGKVTGYYGPLTEKAVKKFQKKNGIESVGTVGPITMTKINEIIGGNNKEESKITICHIPPENTTNRQTITIGKSALEAHLAHGDTVNSCTSTQPTPVAQYYINVVSPNGGETWTTGSSQYIKWSSNIPSTHKIITVRLRDSAGREYDLLNKTPNDGIEQITVPTSLVAGAYLFEIKTFLENQTVFDKSDAIFNITSLTPTSTPVIPPAPTPIPTPAPTVCAPINVSISPSTPQLQNASPGQGGVSLVTFNITANCSLNLNSFAVSLLPMPNGYQNISSLRLYNNAAGTQLGSNVTASSAGLNFTELSQPISPSQTLSLKVVGDISPSAVNGSTVYAVFGGSSVTDTTGTFVGNNASGNIIAGNVITIVAPTPTSTPTSISPTSACLGGDGRIPGLPICLMPENLAGTAWNEVDNATGKVLNTAVCSVDVCGRNGEWRNMKNANGTYYPNGYPPISTYIQTPFNSGYGGQYYTNGVWQTSSSGIVQPGSSQISVQTILSANNQMANVLEAMQRILNQLQDLLKNR